MTREAGVDRRDNFVNQQKATELSRLLDEVFAETLRAGFHGRIEVKMPIQDGTVQYVAVSAEKSYR